VTLIEVYPGERTYNLDETIHRPGFGTHDELRQWPLSAVSWSPGNLSELFHPSDDPTLAWVL